MSSYQISNITGDINKKQNNNWEYVMDAKVSHKPCPCSTEKLSATASTI
jgi:hypothetical protein